MKLSSIQVDRFGVWRDLDLTIPTGQVAVLSGPNGTGKSTLLEFVRGVLLGYSTEIQGKLPEGIGQIPGRVVMLEKGNRHVLSRATGGPAGVGILQIDGRPDSHPEDSQGFLRGLTPELWDGVYCMGLNEIQELSALRGMEVANQIYEASLGPEGHRLVAARRRAREYAAGRSTSAGQPAVVTQLIQERQRLRERLGELQQRPLPSGLTRRESLATDIARREATVAQLRRQKQTLALHARLLPSSRALREARARLERLGPPRNFPERGVERLSEIDAEIQQVRGRGRRLLSRLRQRGGFQPRSRLSLSEAAALHGLVSQRSWFVEVNRQRQQAQQRLRQHQSQLEQLRQTQAAGWSLDGLRALDQSAESEARLWDLGRTLQREQRVLIRLRRARLRLLGRLEDSEKTLREGRRGLPASTLDDALQSVQTQLSVSPQASALRAREQALVEQLKSFVGAVSDPAEHRVPTPLPAWLTWIVSVLFFLGIIVAGWGFIAGVQTSAIAGLIYLFLGLTFGGIAWGLKSQYEFDRSRVQSGLVHRRQQVEKELQGVRLQLRTLPDPVLPKASAGLRRTQLDQRPSGPGFSGFGAAEPADMGHVASQLTQLSELALLERKVERLSASEQRLRQKLRTHRAKWRSTRQSWSELLRGLGFSVNWNVAEVFRSWQSLARVTESVRELDRLADQAETIDQLWRSVETSVANLTLRAPPPQPTTREALDQIDEWCDLLAVWHEDQIARREWRQQSSGIHRSLRRLRRRLRHLEDARQALWVQAGAGDRTEFLSLSSEVEQRSVLRQEVTEAEQSLARLSRESPEALALLARLETSGEFESPGELSAVEAELARQERELAAAHDELAELDLEFEAWSNDATLADLRLDLQFVEQQLDDALQTRAATKLAEDCLDSLCRSFERRTQPETLSLASDFLQRLTCGKYRRVWTPLGERQLQVEDSFGHSAQIETLSRGAREQLYLAIRLAVIQRLAQTGLEMPLLLDDVFVNFDAPRTEAAIDLLQEVAKGGQQVLFFTCHQHVVTQFEERGMHPTWLHRLQEMSPLERRAG
jgi:uncharacterized protein YhaN